MRNFLKENRDIFGRIDVELRKKMGITASKEPIPAVPNDGEEQAVAAVKTKR